MAALTYLKRLPHLVCRDGRGTRRSISAAGRLPDAVHSVCARTPPRYPSLKLGGPVFEGVTLDIKVWADAEKRTAWLGRFLDYLESHGALDQLALVARFLGQRSDCSDLVRRAEMGPHRQPLWSSPLGSAQFEAVLLLPGLPCSEPDKRNDHSTCLATPLGFVLQNNVP